MGRGQEVVIQALAPLAMAALSMVEAEPEVTLEAPAFHVKGEPFMVEVTYSISMGAAGDEPTALAAWRLLPAMFEVDGEPLADRSYDHEVPLAPGSTLTIRLDLESHLPEARTFTLAVTGAKSAPQKVDAFERVAEGLDFMTLPADELDDYQVMLATNRGTLLLELWPDLAPNHVRNFLDLSYTGFYDGTQFHRVSPSFMIQGGCPNTKTNNKSSWGTGRGPRMLDGEFGDKSHERGILSMARGNSPNSASSQFFIMTTKNARLDDPAKPYSVFGHLVSGDATLEAIANAPGQLNSRDGTVRPAEPQRIEKAIVLKPIHGS